MTQITDSYMVTHQVLYWGDVEDAIEKYFINKRAEQTENISEIPNNCEPQTEVETMSCAECKHRPIGAEICEELCHYEPQTDWHYDEQDATWYPYKHEDEPNLTCTVDCDLFKKDGTCLGCYRYDICHSSPDCPWK